MCQIVYQPRDARTPPHLLHSAAEYNPDGMGFMGFTARGPVHVERHSRADPERIDYLADRFAGLECAWHFRRRTRGSSAAENVHPFRIGEALYLMHNGTAGVPVRNAGRSDTWHLVHDYLGPLLSRRRGLLYDRDFRRLVEQWLGPQNRLVVLDAAAGQIELLQAADGFRVGGIWLSNARWIDRTLLGLDPEGLDGVHPVGSLRFA